MFPAIKIAHFIGNKSIRSTRFRINKCLSLKQSQSQNLSNKIEILTLCLIYYIYIIYNIYIII